MSLLELSDLTVAFGRAKPVVDRVSLTVEPGECVAIVGESGSGKSITARALLGLVGNDATVTTSGFRLLEQDVSSFNSRQWRALRGREVAMVHQDAMVSLDPLRTVGAEIAEAVRMHDPSVHGRSMSSLVHERVIQLLDAVGVPEPERRSRQYPHQLSGGLRQRALIASALAGNPRLLIADEPTTALDVVVQKQILDLLGAVREDGRSLVLISHDLAVVAQLADRVMVMRDGRVVESGLTREILDSPSAEYTKTLIASIPRPRPPRSFASGKSVLSAREVRKTFADGEKENIAIDVVSLTVTAGETLGIVGESGSGKSTLAKVLLGLVSTDSGVVELNGMPWSTMPENRKRKNRNEIQLIHQNPYGAFDPRLSVERLIGEGLRDLRGHARRERTVDLLAQVGLDRIHLHRKVSQLSGGQRQRVSIARALAPSPNILVCDEPVSALDVSVQAQVLDLLDKLQEETGVAMIFISHDLGVVRRVSDRVLVLRNGVVVEEGPTEDVLEFPNHPYTRQLIDAVPTLEKKWSIKESGAR